MNRSRIARTVKRMAYQMAESTRGRSIVLIGLDLAGQILAERTASTLRQASKGDVRLFSLDTESLQKGEALFGEEEELSESVLILFSDVIFTGRTLYRALGYLPVEAFETAHIAVLIDRGHRMVPISPRFTGMEIPTKAREIIEVRLEEDREDVTLCRG